MAKSGLGNSNAVSVRVESCKASKAGGQRNHDLRKQPIPQYVDQSLMHLNSTIIEPLSPTKLRTECETRRSQRETKRTMKANAGICFSGIITFGSKAQTDFEELDTDAQNAAYRDVAQAIADRLNTTLTGLVAHRDETSPHAHFQMPGFDRDGQPLSMSVKRNVTSELQTIAAKVIQRHVKTIGRGKDKYDRIRDGAEISETVNKSVRQLHEDLPTEIAAAEKQRDFLRSEIEKQTRRIEKLQAKEELNTKQANNLRRYELRLNAREDELTALEIDAASLMRTAHQTLLDAKSEALKASQEAVQAKEQVRALDTEVKQLEGRRAALKASVELREAVRGLPKTDVVKKLSAPLIEVTEKLDSNPDKDLKVKLIEWFRELVEICREALGRDHGLTKAVSADLREFDKPASEAPTRPKSGSGPSF